MNKHYFIKTSDDKWYCFGNNGMKQLGIKNDECVKIPIEFKIPKKIDSSQNQKIKKIMVSYLNSFAVTYDNKIFLLGQKHFSKRDSIWDGSDNPFELDLPFTESILKISCGSKHFFFLTVQRRCFYFGDNDYGQIGMDFTGYASQLAEFKLSNSKSKIQKIICGGYHTFMLTKDEKCYCFGYNDDGQLGLGDNEIGYFPTEFKFQINSFPKIKKIKCGVFHSFIQTSDLKWYAFGRNFCGQLGLGDYNNINYPTELKSPSPNFAIKTIYCGGHHNFLKTQENKFYCFGDNYRGQLGLGDKNNRNYPTEYLFQLSKKEEIEIEKDHEKNEQPNKKQKIEFIKNQNETRQIKSITCGNDTTFILTKDEKCFCFGNNENGQLGLGDEKDKLLATQLNYPFSNSNITYIVSNRSTFSHWCLLIAHEKDIKSIWRRVPIDMIKK